MTVSSRLKEYTVIYEEHGVLGWQFFECQADDGDHAAEQCENAYSSATVLWVNIGYGPRSRLMESMKIE